jgi:hypothetical protein
MKDLEKKLFFYFKQGSSSLSSFFVGFWMSCWVKIDGTTHDTIRWFNDQLFIRIWSLFDCFSKMQRQSISVSVFVSLFVLCVSFPTYSSIDLFLILIEWRFHIERIHSLHFRFEKLWTILCLLLSLRWQKNSLCDLFHSFDIQQWNCDYCNPSDPYENEHFHSCVTLFLFLLFLLFNSITIQIDIIHTLYVQVGAHVFLFFIYSIK